LTYRPLDYESLPTYTVTVKAAVSKLYLYTREPRNFYARACVGERRNMQPGCDVCPFVFLSVCLSVISHAALRDKLLFARARRTQSFPKTVGLYPVNLAEVTILCCYLFTVELSRFI